MASEIKVDTISEKTSAGGVTIDGLLIKDGGISGDVSLIGTTPTFTIGDAGAEDATLLFDGNAQDFHIGLDDTADDLVIGVGSTLGTTTAIAIDENANTTFSGTVTVGVDDTGKDVKLFGATSGKYWLWDESADGVVAVSNLQQTGTITVGVDDTGHDVKFFGATASSYMLWDESADALNLVASGLGVVSAKDLGAGIHIKTADSGAGANSAHDELIIEGSGDSGLCILSGASSIGAMIFADSGDSSIAQISYDHSENAMKFGTSGGIRATITSAGDINIPADDKGISFGASQDLWFGGGAGEEYLQINRGSTQVADPIGTGASVVFYVPGTSTQAEVNIIAGEAKSAAVKLTQDQGDDNQDLWWFGQVATDFAANDALYWTDYDSGSTDVEMRLEPNGVVTAEGAVNASTTVEYAEFFEWKTELANDDKITDTYGLSVVLDNGKVRLAETGEEAKVLGVVRPNNVSAMVGGSHSFKYKDRYEKNVWGEPIREEYTLVDWDETRTKYWKDGDTLPDGVSIGDVRGTYAHHHKYHKDRIPTKVLKPEHELNRSEPNWHTLASNLTSEDLVVPSTDGEKSAANYTERTTYKKDKGDHKKDDKLTRKKVNASYDPSLTYTPREKRRKEWCVVGLIGQVEVRDSAIIPTHWTKLKNLETGIDMYYVFNKQENKWQRLE